MAGKARWPRKVRFGNVAVSVFRRGNGKFGISWLQDGLRMRTTRTRESDALEWAAQKARHLDQVSGRQWVPPADADMIVALRRLAGPADGALGRLVADLRAALDILGAEADLVAAARWYADHGPKDSKVRPVADAVAKFLGEYRDAPAATRRTFTTELAAFSAKHGWRDLQSVGEEVLREWVDRRAGGNRPAPRTVRNRITTLVTMWNRCKAWGWLPDAGKTAPERLRRPKLPTAGREILTVPEGAALLEMVRGERPELEIYVIVAGWLGLRPSEIQRLRWSAFDFSRGYLHLCPEVAAKVGAERYVPIDPRVSGRLQALREKVREAGGGWKDECRVTLFRAREFVSSMARKRAVLTSWPSDVLRHSYCSYRLALLGDIGRVAEEAGNSAAIIRSNYRRPLVPEDGAEWWALLDPHRHEG